MIHVRRMITRLKYSWSVLKLACAIVFATNVYLLLRLFSGENAVGFTENQKVAAAMRHFAQHPLAHLLPSQDSLHEVPKCTRPKLSLQHDALSFAFEPIPPLKCSGSNFFYLHNGYLIPNKTSKFSKQLKMCEIYAVKRESDFNAYLEKLVEINDTSSVKINEDFIYVRCRFYRDNSELRTSIEGEDNDKNDSQLGIIPGEGNIRLDTQLVASEKDKVILLSPSQAQDNLMLDSPLDTRQNILTVQHNTHLSAIQDSTDTMGYDALSDVRQDRVKVIHYSQMDTKQVDKFKLTHDNQLAAKQEDNDTNYGPFIAKEKDKPKLSHNNQLDEKQNTLIQDIEFVTGKENKDNNYDQLDAGQKDKFTSSHDTQLDIKQDKIAFDTHLGMKQDKLPHNTQFNVKQDKILHDRKLNMKQDKIYDTQFNVKQDQLPHNTQLNMKSDKLPHNIQLNMKQDKLPHNTQLNMKQDKIYDTQFNLKQDQLPHNAQLSIKQDKISHDTQLNMKQDKIYDTQLNKKQDKMYDTKLNMKKDKIYDTQFNLKQDKILHNTQFNMIQTKISHDTQINGKQKRYDTQLLNMKQDKIYDTQLNMKQDKINDTQLNIKKDKIYDTQLNVKQDRISYDTNHEPRKDKVKVKRDTSRIEVDNSSNSHLFNKGVFLKTQSFNQTQFNVTHLGFVSSKQNTKDITVAKKYSKDNQSRPSQEYKEVIKHKNVTSDEDKNSLESLRYLENNKRAGEKTETSPLLKQTHNSLERLQLSSQEEDKRFSNSLAEPTDLEMVQGQFSSTNSKHTAVDNTVERNIHTDDSLPNIEVENYADLDGGNSELEDSDQQGLDERFRNFIRGRDEIYDQWDDANFEEMYMEMPACDEEQYLVQVSPLKHVLDRSRNNKAVSKSYFNVLMFGIDSMSNLAFQRKLPDSLNFLKKELDAVLFEGYNIVGDGTTQALLPMFLGQLQHEIPDILERHLDDLDFVWKRYRQRGYVTLFAEDEPHLGVFNLRLQGFEELPTDHYMRYFWQSQAQSHLKSDCSTKYCTGPTPNHQYLFQYLTDFFHKYPKIPHFAVGFSGELSHDEVNPSQYLDPDLLKFLTHFKAEGYLNNTVLILFADHGSRKGKLRSTLQGKLEERLPFMSMVFPKSFRRKHRVLYENLKRNARGLTTPFDVHKTLLDILDVPKVYQASQQKAERGVSLFRSIPENRTCAQAGVDTHWCTCAQEIPIPTTDPVAKAAAEAVVATINNLTQASRQQCALLQLFTIKSASLVLPNMQVLTFHQSTDDGNYSARFGNATVDMAEVQITLETDKCRGVFEATVHVQFQQDDNESSVDNQGRARLIYSAFEHSISRIDTYGSQSACICKSSPNIMKYCCCERYLLGEKLASC